MPRPSRQLNFPVNAKLPSDLRRDFCKLVYWQESNISDELRVALREYVIKRKWMFKGDSHEQETDGYMAAGMP